MADSPRAILHLDLDAFFAAVEVLENPTLENKPVVVGGRPEQRGVVAAASYPARAFGIHSAMPMAQAASLCPDLVIVPARHSIYREYSYQVMSLLHEVTPLVEQMSVDEAFLDVTDQVAAWAGAVDLARQLQQRVRDEVQLSASLGVATNKLVAKVASDRDKPGGLTVVQPGQEAAFLAPLPVRALWGVGPVTAQKLAGMGVRTVADLAQVSETELEARFGQHGRAMARKAQGIDRRPVVTEHEVKSVSHERTFSRDLGEAEALEAQLQTMSRGVARRLRKAEMAAGTVSIKIRYADFTTLTRQTSLSVPTDEEEIIYRAAVGLLHKVWRPGQRVRLLGVGGQQLSPPAGQLRLL
ncbi:MAG: DNA polymerase IV [Anaerolineae bacterium]|jgi:DNA polymerase-4